MSRGLSRIPEVLGRIPVSRSNWWNGVKEGRFPPPIKLSERCTAWRNSDLDELEELLARGQDWRDHIETKQAA